MAVIDAAWERRKARVLRSLTETPPDGRHDMITEVKMARRWEGR